MSMMENEIWAEAARESFYEAVEMCDWDTARAILKDMEDKKISTYQLRRDMNTAMDDEQANREPEDYSNSKVEDYGL